MSIFIKKNDFDENDVMQEQAEADRDGV